MKERIRIGLYYVGLNMWMGGVYYARNLLKALDTLSDADKPFIDIYCLDKESFEELKAATRYPYLGMVIINPNRLRKRLIRKIVSVLMGERARDNINMFKIRPSDQMLYPYAYGSDKNILVFWKPDFQEKHLPEFFSKKIVASRDELMKSIGIRGIPIVFSSYDSKNDFKRYYPEFTNKTFVVHFAVDHDDTNYAAINDKDVLERYGIADKYLLCANQFWKHKNHLFLFKSYKQAKERGLKMQLVCTGRLSDYRNPSYIEELKSYIDGNGLNDFVVLTGFVSSEELTSLIKNAYAIVQPSLFEGWNTTVEDCKYYNKFIFLSDLPVHREQCKENVCFFNPYDERDLANKILTVKPTDKYYDYSGCLQEFGRNFLQVIQYVVNRSKT